MYEVAFFPTQHDLETNKTAEEKIQSGGGINKRTGKKTMSTKKSARTKSSLLPTKRENETKRKKRGGERKKTRC